jgi:hypothetical protein
MPVIRKDLRASLFILVCAFTPNELGGNLVRAAWDSITMSAMLRAR